MSSFKLIAVRPLLDCAVRYRKVLSRGKIYPLYQGYRFLNRSGLEALPGDEVFAVSRPKTARHDMHDVATADGYPLTVNISAVVGKNGTGKSTLMDLLFGATYLVSLSQGLLKDSPERLEKELKEIPDQMDKLDKAWAAASAKQQVLREKFNDAGENKKNYDFDKLTGEAALNEEKIKAAYELIETLRNREKHVHGMLAEMRQMAQELRVEIYYEHKRSVYYLKVSPDGAAPVAALYRLGPARQVDPELSRTWLPLSLAIKEQHFFYTIASNYSHYALNALQMGNWVNSLFHKNDGYKTPIVINPMRDDGNFDINRELLLGKYRLLSNLIIQRKILTDLQKPVPLTDQLSVYRIWLTVDRDKVEEPKIWLSTDGLKGKSREIGMIKDIFMVFFDDEDFAAQLPAGNGLVDLLLNYILEKVKDMRKYDGLGHFKLSRDGRSDANRDYFKQLRDERSHIAFKLNQAIHFLKRAADQNWPNPFLLSGNEFDGTGPIVFKPTLEDLLKWTGEPAGAEIISRLPPSIFKIDIELSGTGRSTSFFQELSSGEQQLIHTIHTVLYHLNNLQSVRYSDLPRLHYPAINLVFDEIELYFHPAYQRSFINELLNALRRLYVGENEAIKMINIVFLTHSPFILSDIPKDQITLLSVDPKTGETVYSVPETQTFASNINELLSGSFFLDGTLMGIFAEDEVNRLIKAVKSGEPLSLKQEQSLELIGDSYLRNSLKHFLRRSHDQDRTN